MKASDIIGKLKSELQAANALGKGFSKKHQTSIRSGISRTARIANSFVKMLKAQDFGGLDDFFFSREELVPGGKEYWFFDVVSTKGDKTLFVLAFGSSDSKALVNSQKAKVGDVSAVGWFYSNEKKVFLDKSISLERS